jgi:hypothetical protein
VHKLPTLILDTLTILKTAIHWTDTEVAKKKKDPASKTVQLPCGCVYQDKGWLLTRFN